MSKYTKGQTFTMNRESVFMPGIEVAAHVETLKIVEVLPPTKSIFSRIEPVQMYRVTRQFVADGINTTNEVKLTDRDIDNIVI